MEGPAVSPHHSTAGGEQAPRFLGRSNLVTRDDKQERKHARLKACSTQQLPLLFFGQERCKKRIPRQLAQFFLAETEDFLRQLIFAR